MGTHWTTVLAAAFGKPSCFDGMDGKAMVKPSSIGEYESPMELFKVCSLLNWRVLK